MSVQTEAERTLAFMGIARKAHDDAYVGRSLEMVLAEARNDLCDFYGGGAQLSLESGTDVENRAPLWRAVARVQGKRGGLVIWRSTDWHPTPFKAACEIAWFLWAQVRPDTFPLREKALT